MTAAAVVVWLWVPGKVRRAAEEEGHACFVERSPPALKSCSGSLEKKAPPPTAAAAAAAAADSRTGPRDLAAGAPAPRCWLRFLAAPVGGWCSSPEKARLRCGRVSVGAGSDTGAPGDSGGARRRWCALGRRAGVAGRKRARLALGAARSFWRGSGADGQLPRTDAASP